VIEPGSERVELRLPILAVPIEPQRGLEDRADIEAAPADPAGALLLHEPGPHEDLDVARHRLKRDVEWRGQFRDKQIFAIKPRQHGPPHRIGERREDAVERRFRHRAFRRVHRRRRNHAVDNTQPFR